MVLSVGEYRVSFFSVQAVVCLWERAILSVASQLGRYSSQLVKNSHFLQLLSVALTRLTLK